MTDSQSNQTITLRWAQSKGASAALIRYWTRFDYNHVEAVVHTTDGIGFLGAQADGVKIRKPDYDKSILIKEIFGNVYLGYWQYQTVMLFLNSQIGKPYDFKAILGFPLDKNMHTHGDYDCSALIAAAFIAAKAPLLNTGKPLFAEKPSMITPRDLALSPFVHFDNVIETATPAQSCKQA